ncbi:Hypothetical protein GbCGDNIH6_8247 [Granulibacter bethesdensis]|uniref:hypothetical protein n=1 Tax=Granulibacter bethesdensis TaxID=364410 RepID=UPI00090A4C48|nr:hypothetical protein [Granulibacter bethesdensis]APH56986.1 Hypothetical protein GbCGDNIH6_8247 [Granulibacter bethesdensis]
MQPAYVVRAYVIGFALLALVAWVRFHAPSDHGGTDRYLSLAYLFICSLLFPFAKLVWDELRDVALGGNVFFINGLIALILKVFINGLLWAFALFIAPIGLLYLWFRTRAG